MYFLQTIFLYLFLFVSMYFLCKKAQQTTRWEYVIFAILVYSVVFGMRYDVGVDQLAYLESYKSASINSYNINSSHYESGFRFLMMSLIDMEAHFAWFFGIVAFLQLFLVFASVKPHRDVYPFLTFTFMIGCVWLTYANGLRQQLAFCFFALSVLFVEKKQWLLYYLMIALAMSMHKTAILLVLFYPLLRFKEEWFKNEKLQIGLLLVAIVIGEMGFVQNYLGQLETYASLLGYEDYFQDRYSEKMYKEIARRGIGYYVLLITNFILIWHSSKYKEYFKSKYVYYIYNLYFIGVLMKYAFAGSHLLQRINYYFYGFEFIVAAFALLYARKSNKKMYWMLSAMYVLTFAAIMFRMEDNTALFRFFWQIERL